MAHRESGRGLMHSGFITTYLAIPTRLRPKKIPVVLVPDPIFFCRPYYFFNAIDHATLFSPGGCGLLIQRAKMASVVTLIIEPNCLGTLLKIAQQKTAKTMKKIFKTFFFTI
jgi:hypothetical protein